MWNVKVGDKVVCINDTFDAIRRENLNLPVKDEIYTVREVRTSTEKPLNLLLEEVVNIARQWKDFFGEPSFDISRFRPLKESSIEIFQKLLIDPPTKILGDPDDENDYMKEKVKELADVERESK